MRTPATNSISPTVLRQMKLLASDAANESGHQSCGRAMLVAVKMLEDMDTDWTQDVNKLRAKVDELEAAKAGPYQHFFFTCPEPGRDSNGIIEIFEKCRLKRDFGQFRRGTTIPQIILNYADGTIRLFDGDGMVEFKVELIQQG